MAKKNPWHSIRPEVEVWHDNTDCNTGNNIENENWARGKGNKKRKCKECKRLGI